MYGSAYCESTQIDITKVKWSLDTRVSQVVAPTLCTERFEKLVDVKVTEGEVLDEFKSNIRKDLNKEDIRYTLNPTRSTDAM